MKSGHKRTIACGIVVAWTAKRRAPGSWSTTQRRRPIGPYDKAGEATKAVVCPAAPPHTRGCPYRHPFFVGKSCTKTKGTTCAKISMRGEEGPVFLPIKSIFFNRFRYGLEI